ncbi:MAG: hypothetical protein ACQSGP_00650 [Frankia sp.]
MVVVTNHSSKTSDYIITVAMNTTGTGAQLGTGNVAVNNLAPGQSSTPQDANSLTAAPSAGYTCKVARVDRFASTG